MRCVNLKYLLVNEMIVQGMRFLPEDTTVTTAPLVKTKENLNKISVPEETIEAETTVIEAGIEMPVEDKTEAVSKKETGGKAQTGEVSEKEAEVKAQTEVASEIETSQKTDQEVEAIEAGMIAIEVALEIEMLVELQKEEALKIEVKVKSEEAIKTEALRMIEREVAIEKDRKENTNHTIAQKLFTMTQPIVQFLGRKTQMMIFNKKENLLTSKKGKAILIKKGQEQNVG